MEYLGQDYLKKRIRDNQKFLLRLLHLHIGNYYPLRKWLGIDYKEKIDDITHLSFGFNTKHFPMQQSRTYQHPDLGYKLNLVLDKIPQLALLPALLQPAYGLGALAFFFLTTTTYQPSTKDTYLDVGAPNTNYGNDTGLIILVTSYARQKNILLHFDTSDIPNGAIFSQGDVGLYMYSWNGQTFPFFLNRLTQTAWVETQATWNIYSTGNNWASAGGDYTETNRGTSPTLSTPPLWITISACQLIQDCYNNQSKHVHILGCGNTANLTQARYFYSREYADTSLRPKLTVTYTVPTTYYKTLAATEVSSIDLSKIASFYKILAVVESSVINFKKGFSKTLAVIETSIASLKKGLFKSLNVIEVSIPYLLAQKVLGKLLSVVENSIIALSKLSKKILSVIVTTIPVISLFKSFYRTLLVIESSGVSLIKGMFKSVAVSAVAISAVSLVKTFYRTLATTEISIPSLSKIFSYFRSLPVVENSIAVLSKISSIFKTLSVTEISVATMSWTRKIPLLATAISISTISRLKTFYRTLVATVITIVKLKVPTHYWDKFTQQNDDYHDKYN